MTTQSAAGESNATEGAAVQRAVGFAAGVSFSLHAHRAACCNAPMQSARKRVGGEHTLFTSL